MAMRHDRVFYAVLFLVTVLLWASVSSAHVLDQRLILTDHVRKARWVGMPAQSIEFQAQDMNWFLDLIE